MMTYKHHGSSIYASHMSRRSMLERVFGERYVLYIIAIVGMLISLLVMYNDNAEWLLKASLLDITGKSITFEGTQMPIKNTVNWVELSDEERQMTFDNIPKDKIIPLPKYDISAMQKGYNDDYSDPIYRNTYVSYPVPYSGNYNLDATEKSGSHPGIDIKSPIGTPVYPFMAGVVVKVDDQPSGYGKHIVIAHPDVIDPSDKSKKMMLLSGYAHLSETLVATGDSVHLTTMIGKVGDTGLATTPHLHFQVEKETAPYHLYWPFTWDDVKDAGYDSYFDGVRYGIGKDKIAEYQVHPIEYMRFVSSETVANNDAVASSGGLDSSINTPTELIQEDIVLPKEKEDTLSEPVKEVVDTPLDTDKTPAIQSNKELKEIVIDTKKSIFKDLKSDDYGYKYAKKLMNKGIMEGDPNGNFRGNDNLNRAEAVKIIMAFIELEPSSKGTYFDDIIPTEWFAGYVNRAYEKGYVKGYEGNLFKPAHTISLVEFLKIALLASKTKLQMGDDVWYTTYINTAKQLDLLDNMDIYNTPDKKITRIQAAEILYNLL